MPFKLKCFLQSICSAFISLFSYFFFFYFFKLLQTHLHTIITAIESLSHTLTPTHTQSKQNLKHLTIALKFVYSHLWTLKVASFILVIQQLFLLGQCYVVLIYPCCTDHIIYHKKERKKFTQPKVASCICFVQPTDQIFNTEKQANSHI